MMCGVIVVCYDVLCKLGSCCWKDVLCLVIVLMTAC